jgi:hypothetical protein
MTRTVWPRTIAVLALLLFMAPALFALPRRAKESRPERGAFAWLAQALDRLIPGLKSSGTMDPDGKPSLLTPPASTTSDSSGTMDPDGRK